MKLSPIEQAFVEVYRRVNQCNEDITMIFLESERTDKGQDDFYKKYSEYYSHLMDTYIAFEMGIEYGRKNPVEEKE